MKKGGEKMKTSIKLALFAIIAICILQAVSANPINVNQLYPANETQFDSDQYNFTLTLNYTVNIEATCTVTVWEVKDCTQHQT